MSQEFVWPIRIYYEDTDAGGLVYHSCYVNFLERARTEWLRYLGFEQDALAHQPGILFAVHWMELNYLRPAHFNEQIFIHSKLFEIRRVSMTFAQEAKRVNNSTGDNTCLLSAKVRIVCLDVRRHRPVPIPDFVLKAIQ